MTEDVQETCIFCFVVRRLWAGKIRTIIFPSSRPPAGGFVRLCNTIVPAIATITTRKNDMREDLTMSGQKNTS